MSPNISTMPDHPMENTLYYLEGTEAPGKIQYPFYRRLGRPQGRSGLAENLVPKGIRSRTVQPPVSRYTD